jgi:hypothetical protein
MQKPTSTLRFLLGRLAAWLLAVAVAYLLATITATQAVIASLQGMGVDIGLGLRLSMTLRDVAGMASMFLPMVAFALLIAFMTAALLCRWLARWRLPLYLLAGAVALVSIHLGLHLAFGITPIAIARSPGGLALQGFAGTAGGFCYLWWLRRQPLELAIDPQPGLR